MMWQTGHSETEAITNWQKEYDQPMFTALFAELLQKRAEHPPLVPHADEDRQTHQRPPTVDFPYRGKVYRMETNAGPPKRHIVLPNGTVLVVCQWNGRVPSCLADIRRSLEPMLPHRIAEQFDALEAFEIPLLPGQTTKAMAFLDWEGQRYAVDYDSHALVKLPDGRLYRVKTCSLGDPVEIKTLTPFDPSDSYMPYQLEHFGTTPAIPVAPDYPGMAHEPRDLRIRFAIQGERFVLSHEAYEQRKGIVSVPGHGFYQIGIYLESSPIQLGRLAPLPTGDYEEVAAALRIADAIDVEPYEPQRR